MKKINEIKEQSNDQLEYRLKEIEEQLFKLTNELKLHRKLEKPHLLKELKKEKARILTLLTIRKSQEAK